MGSIEDIALRAGVHKSTASRVLNNVVDGVRISDATRARVLEAAAALQYRANPFARSLRAGRAPFVAILCGNLGHPFQVALIDSVEDVVRERGYYPLISDGPFAGGELVPGGVGAVLALGDAPLDAKQVAAVLKSGTTMVAVATDPGHPDVPVVHLDSDRAVALAVDHLAALGHRRIAFFAGGSTWESDARVAAYRRWMQVHGLEPLPLLRPQYDCGSGKPASGRGSVVGELLADGAAVCATLIESDAPPTAIISTSSLRAMGLLGAAHRRGLVVPRDLSVVSFDLDPLVEHTVPRLTAVAQHIQEQGRLAATLLIDRLEGKAPPDQPRTVAVQPTLIVRESTAPPADGANP